MAQSKWFELYGRMPVFLQNLACSYEGWRRHRSRFGGGFQDCLRAAEARTYWGIDEIRNYRDQRLRTFVHHCYHTVPYYKARFDALGISPERVQTPDDLSQIPILTKEEVQDNISMLQSSAVPLKHRIPVETNGTTGAGLRITSTQQADYQKWATWWRYRRWHGIQMNTWSAHFGGKQIVPVSQMQPPFWRYNIPGRQILFSAYHMSPRNLSYYVQELRHRRPPWLHGYPSLLTLVAGHILENKIDLGYDVQWVTIGSENLLPQQADLMTRAFGVRPKQHYGLAEAVANISECEYGSLHVDEDFAAVEFMPQENGGGFRLIGTNFTNLATPLLRYDTQDVVTLTDNACACGRPGRVVSEIDGRAEDYVTLKNGRRVGRMAGVFQHMSSIREAQIYQKSEEKIVVRIVPGTSYTADNESTVMREIKKRLGDEIGVEINYVERVPRSKSGKLRFVVSDLPQGQLGGPPL